MLSYAFCMRVGRRYTISGRVQGVGFRFFTEGVARRERVDGWVRNLPDGRVEILAEGEADAVDRFERQIRRGPAGAQVERVDVDGAPADGHGAGFSVR